MNIQYYIIHNGETSRKETMIKILTENGVNIKNVKWVLHPNKNEITEELEKKITSKPLKKGYISVTYKHYLSLKDIVENKYEYSVIMEDNIGEFLNNIPECLELYLKQLPMDWDILFDTTWCSYKSINEENVIPDKVVYKKTNEVTNYCHGGTRVAQFYFLNLKCAEKLYNNYLPFDNAPDWWMNTLFRKLNINSYWSEPANVVVRKNHISSTN
tara:strand:+ start:52 stop:693 length:642 start_codon:yes stop_codon:yes gene_type:complete